MRSFIDGLAALYTGNQAGKTKNWYEVTWGTNPTPKPKLPYNSPFDYHWNGYNWERFVK